MRHRTGLNQVRQGLHYSASSLELSRFPPFLSCCNVSHEGLGVAFSGCTASTGLGLCVVLSLYFCVEFLTCGSLGFIVLITPRRVRVTGRTPRAMEEFCHSGLTYNSQALVIRPCKSAKWVSVSRLSYGIPDEVIRESLSRYGRVIQVKMELYRSVYIGTRHVLMDISSPIPSRIQIAGHWCHIFYHGKIPTCFMCHQTGHAQKECSARQGATARAHNHQNDTNVREPASHANPDNHNPDCNLS